MNIKIIIILVIITLIISSVIIYSIKKDTGIDSFFIIDKSNRHNLYQQHIKTSVLQQTEDMDIWVVLKLKNPRKDESYKLVIYHNAESDKEILQTSKIPIEKESPQIIEISVVKKGSLYEKGRYFVKLYCRDILAEEFEFKIQ